MVFLTMTLRSMDSDRLKIVFTLVAALFFQAIPVADAFTASPKVRVRILENASNVRLRGFDLKFFSVTRGATLSGQVSDRRPAATTDKLTEWRIDCPTGATVRARLVQPSWYSIQPVIFAGPLLIETPAGFSTVENRPYREQIVIHPIRTKKGWGCEVVNHVDIEKYLDGLVNGEFNAGWSKSAIDSQVVAARTYAYYQIKVMASKKGGSHFDLDSTIKDQVYDGSIREDFRASLSADRTRGEILKPQGARGDLEPIKAYYHSTCGGRTELPQKVWGTSQSGFKHRVDCPYCRSSPSYIWDIPVDSTEVQQSLVNALRTTVFAEIPERRFWPEGWQNAVRSGRLVGLETSQPNESGRTEEVRMKFSYSDREYVLPVGANRFRLWLGGTRVKSTAFQIYGAGEGKFVLRGRGYGHGVGLCQWGAKTMGEKGKTSREILRYYYPDAVIVRAW